MGEPQHERFGNVEVTRVDIAPPPSVGIPIVKGYTIAREQIGRLLHACDASQADVVVGHSPFLYAKAGWKCAHEAGRPFIYDIHKLAYDSVIPGAGLKGIKKRLRQEWHRHQEATIAREADAVIVQTDAIKRRVAEIYRVSDEKVHVIPMGVDPALFDPKDVDGRRNEIRKELGCADRICFLYNGNLEPQTGIDFFLEAVAELPRQTKARIVILVLGRGSMKGQVEELSTREPELVRFLGLLDYSEMPAYYRACDVQVLPYPDLDCWKTNVPTKLLEGMAMERLILASRLSGIGSVLNGEGLTYEPGVKAALQKRIEEIVSNFEEFDPLRSAARQAVIRKYDWRVMRTQFDDLVSQLAKRRSRSAA